MVTVIGVPLTRISSGSSTTRVSGRATASSAVTCCTGAARSPVPMPRSNRMTIAFDTGVFDLAAV